MNTNEATPSTTTAYRLRSRTRHSGAEEVSNCTDPCPGCDQADGVRWVSSTPDADVWSCRHCGTEWTITVDTPGGVAQSTGAS